jgi:hypothetical protein
MRDVLMGVVALAIPTAAVAKSPIYDVARFDVAGVRLGMTPAEVREALVAKGYSLSDDHMYRSWEARVAEEAGKYANTPKISTRAVGSTSAEGPEYQRVEVSYEVSPRGSLVSRVVYSRPGSQGDIRPMVIQKYGPASNVGVMSLGYLSSKDDQKPYFMGDSSLPSLYVYHSNTGRSSINLDYGQIARLRHEAEFAAAVKVIAPKYGEPSF